MPRYSASKRLKRRVSLGRVEAITLASRPNARWSSDFVHDTLHNGRRIRTFNVVDDFARESLAIEVETSISGTRVVRVLDRIAIERGAYPQTVVMDNGTEPTTFCNGPEAAWCISDRRFRCASNRVGR